MSKYSVDKWIIEWEIIQAQFPGDHDKHVHWVLNNPEIPEANKTAILKRYGYETSTDRLRYGYPLSVNLADLRKIYNDNSTLTLIIWVVIYP
jgi:hypothetical protein